ncbi:hypothetical protein KRM28CT15_15080 [Krasilnikovia sp. M28-CT-15]
MDILTEHHNHPDLPLCEWQRAVRGCRQLVPMLRELVAFAGGFGCLDGEIAGNVGTEVMDHG